MWGIFTSSGAPQKAYYSFLAFQRMLETPQRIGIGPPEGENISALSGMSEDKKTIRVLITNLGSGKKTIRLDLKGLPWSGNTVYEQRIINESHDLDTVKDGSLAGMDPFHSSRDRRSVGFAFHHQGGSVTDRSYACGRIRDAEAVRAHYGEPSHMSKAKQLDHLDAHCKAFIQLSPFVVMATTDAAGRADASPRGDRPGQVAMVIDDKTLIIPDRVGNRRTDTINNITENPHVGLLFMVPGINETLRVNGTVRVVIGRSTLEPCLRGQDAYVRICCNRGGSLFPLWQTPDPVGTLEPRTPPVAGALPQPGQDFGGPIAGDKTAEEFEQGIDEQYRTRLY